MRRTGNIFEQESYRGTRVRIMSGVTITLIVCFPDWQLLASLSIMEK